jgi:oxygen-independent coproporphyrinogen III oxidase
MPTGWIPLDGADFVESLGCREVEAPHTGLSLYIHIPFCETLCKFCACNKVILKKEAKGAVEKRQAYLSALHREIEMVSQIPGMARPIHQIHWGGGSPSYLEVSEIEALMADIAKRLNIAPDAEISMEIDPRHTTVDLLQGLHRAGFNRISMGIQDFDPAVQQHVHRIQPFEMVREVTEAIRGEGIGKVNYDLIYGMPYQTGETVRDMVMRTIELHPDRIAFYHYAQIPEKIATQRGMDYKRLPTSEEKLEMFLDALETFPAGGYEFIGLDHFALPDDDLAVALREGTIQRNFQGMTTQRSLDLIGLGVSSITQILGTAFWQKVKEIEAYEAGISAGTFPIERGLHLSTDDHIRQEILSCLYCYGRVDLQEVGQNFGLVWRDYFAREWEALNEIAGDGLVELDDQGGVEVTLPLGRVLLRNIGAVFDAYLDPGAYKLGDRYYYSVSA